MQCSDGRRAHVLVSRMFGQKQKQYVSNIKFGSREISSLMTVGVRAIPERTSLHANLDRALVQIESHVNAIETSMSNVSVEQADEDQRFVSHISIFFFLLLHQFHFILSFSHPPVTVSF
jgi:hypothetical protein